MHNNARKSRAWQPCCSQLRCICLTVVVRVRGASERRLNSILFVCAVIPTCFFLHILLQTLMFHDSVHLKTAIHLSISLKEAKVISLPLISLQHSNNSGSSRWPVVGFNQSLNYFTCSLFRHFIIESYGSMQIYCITVFYILNPEQITM